MRNRGFWAKLECFNPGGSMKEVLATQLVDKARDRGGLLPEARTAEFSGGNLCLGLVLAGEVCVGPVAVVIDTGMMEPIIGRMLAAYCADVVLVDAPRPVGGWEQARKDRVVQALATDHGAWIPVQYTNFDNVVGDQSLDFELPVQRGGIDVRVCLAATGSYSAGVVRMLLQQSEQAPRSASVLQDWRIILVNGSLLLLAAMMGLYLVTFQVYLVLPVQVSVLTPWSQCCFAAGVFAISGVVVVAGQLRTTPWLSDRWGCWRSLIAGLAILAVSYLPLIILADDRSSSSPPDVEALAVSAALLALGSAPAIPFELHAANTFTRNRSGATPYRFYGTVVAIRTLICNGRQRQSPAQRYIAGITKCSALHCFLLAPPQHLRSIRSIANSGQATAII
ncbi:pyridoxal-phosphate dependent enzyme [Mycobacterium xenopi]|uniref:pyridoxal-phosphate dependent enzyme n=1 Tax=Mycobacterium xenopi TaxID=1789 RepID=UPI00092FFF53|nr:pyridoxal-phosphate dependent enzyme [Mycobacterium xenopi]ARV83458.1 pyridoxal-5'-phosphate-dependent protein subunit beta [Mycobacterium intracellulare subsp. chimaera]ASW96269.1 pyridoxal-5'-phosphate-dependent protein subunit beta [Mycobacterium intracellulare]MCA2246022.1 pyridoxal-phosphate dependent enzyme [Mycobacterium sp. WUMAC-067]MCA2317814.1 pyridoxal-phosphate dependent enzyme [Mycobacterium sp. WUMAC-025]ASQ87237.1 pyridoxal-5'-phosphate-dependent protein subunit beta [Mycoba